VTEIDKDVISIVNGLDADVDWPFLAEHRRSSPAFPEIPRWTFFMRNCRRGKREARRLRYDEAMTEMPEGAFDW